MVCFAVVLAATAWSSSRAQAPASYMYILMVNMIGPAANSLWETAGTETLSDGDWKRLAEASGRLTDMAATVSAGGTSAVETERASSAPWKEWSGKFTDAAMAAALAVERKDQAALVSASDSLVEACEGCHTAFPITGAH